MSPVHRVEEPILIIILSTDVIFIIITIIIITIITIITIIILLTLFPPQMII